MSRPRSKKLLGALCLVAEGVTAYQASKVMGVAQSMISRAIKLDANPPIKRYCQSCGQVLRKDHP